MGNFFGIIILQFVGHPPTGMGFDFIVIVPLLPSWCSFFFVFGRRASFFRGFQHPPVNESSTASGNFGALAGNECTPFYSAILTEILSVPVFQGIYTLKKKKKKKTADSGLFV